mmetsp:Transcript_110836/g.220449  ORF Transcript_110836/g.220449 Transcript_110836/m.220449 type:complete len:220 (-) Transcript_110836:454-1113(-)
MLATKYLLLPMPRLQPSGRGGLFGSRTMSYGMILYTACLALLHDVGASHPVHLGASICSCLLTSRTLGEWGLCRLNYAVWRFRCGESPSVPNRCMGLAPCARNCRGWSTIGWTTTWTTLASSMRNCTTLTALCIRSWSGVRLSEPEIRGERPPYHTGRLGLRICRWHWPMLPASILTARRLGRTLTASPPTVHSAAGSCFCMLLTSSSCPQAVNVEVNF